MNLYILILGLFGPILGEAMNFDFQKTEEYKHFTFVDLFSVIGGFHLALHQLGGECVYASEWDKHARKTYEHNFRRISPKLFLNDLFRGDITLEENQRDIPEDFDVLCADSLANPLVKQDSKKDLLKQEEPYFLKSPK